jgi:GNAT superfamily N-acetyltransferase
VVFFSVDLSRTLVDYRVVGWPTDGPRLRLDYRRFAYAGKFVMSTTGKAVATEPVSDGGDAPDLDGPPPSAGDDREHVTFDDAAVVGAVAFNDDRTDSDVLWLRYVTVRRDRRGEGIGGRLCAFVCEHAADRGYDAVRIAVNNPYSYQALYKAGFAYAARETGLAEVVLERPADTVAPCDPQRYRAGMEVFADREDIGDDERAYAERAVERGPPGFVTPPQE